MDNKTVEQTHEKMMMDFQKSYNFNHPEIRYKVKAIGFLTCDENYETSEEIPTKFLERLGELWKDGVVIRSLGFHECELCQNYPSFKDTGEKILNDHTNKIIYIFPHMIFHYIRVHHFKPSDEFIRFVMHSI